MLVLLRVPSFGDRVGAIDPPISQGLVAAAVRARGFEAEVLDLTYGGDQGLSDLEESLSDSNLRVVGMAAYQTNLIRCLKIAALIRHLRPDIHILLGGPQATHMPLAGLAAMNDIDGLCRGPAEQVLPDYLSALVNGGSFPGFLHKCEDQIIDGGRPPVPSFDNLVQSPFEQQIWPLNRYPFTVMFASRGCPYGCAFCYTPASSGRRVSYVPLSRIVSDIALVARAGVKHVFFADPIFVVNRERTIRLLKLLQEQARDISFSCEMRIEHVDAEILENLAKAGFIKVAYGLETASPSVLQRIAKPTDLQYFKQMVEITLDHGIAVEIFCMYGLPGETIFDVHNTFDFIEGLPKSVQEISEPQQFQLYFGTELLMRHREFGIEVLGERPPYFSPGRSYRTQSLGPDEFAELEIEWKRRCHNSKNKGDLVQKVI